MCVCMYVLVCLCLSLYVCLSLSLSISFTVSISFSVSWLKIVELTLLCQSPSNKHDKAAVLLLPVFMCLSRSNSTDFLNGIIPIWAISDHDPDPAVTNWRISDHRSNSASIVSCAASERTDSRKKMDVTGC